MMPSPENGASSAGTSTPPRSLSPAPTSNPTPTSHPEPQQPTSNPSEPIPNAAQALLPPNSSVGAGGSAPGSVNGGNSAPPSRPGTSAGGVKEAESIDDLLGAPAARKGGTVRKGKRGRGYVDVLGGGGGGGGGG
ncbi:MAG: vesicle coat component [Candelina submexicana]|nr:MAG: vesicle coat component [Candelina submexicana]